MELTTSNLSHIIYEWLGKHSKVRATPTGIAIKGTLDLADLVETIREAYSRSGAGPTAPFGELTYIGKGTPSDPLMVVRDPSVAESPEPPSQPMQKLLAEIEQSGQDWKWWFDMPKTDRLQLIRQFRAGGGGTGERAGPKPNAERSDEDLVQLVTELFGRLALYDTKVLHDAAFAARGELLRRLASRAALAEGSRTEKGE